MKKLFLFILFFTSRFIVQSQSVNILQYDGGFNNIESLVTNAYQNAGFEQVNFTFGNIDLTLTPENYQILIVQENDIWGPVPPNTVGNLLSDEVAELIENYVLNGGHVILCSESSETIYPNKSLIIINNIYGTNLVNGPFYVHQYGPSINRVHPSNGPGGLSVQPTIVTTGSYSTTLNVPNCNKLYTSGSQDANYVSYSTCTHTISLFPSKPTPNEGSIFFSNEANIPFLPFGG